MNSNAVVLMAPLVVRRRIRLLVSMAMDVVGRLKPGVTLAGASGDLQALARGLADHYSAVNKGTSVTLVPLKSDVVGPVGPLLLLLVTAVLFVLLIAGVNVANLLLARSSRRTAEVAVRTALGASRRRIVRQFLTESLLLALAGGWGASSPFGEPHPRSASCRRFCCLALMRSEWTHAYWCSRFSRRSSSACSSGWFQHSTHRGSINTRR